MLGVRSVVLGTVNATFLVALTTDLKGERLRRSTRTDRQFETVWWWRRLTILFYRDRVNFDSQAESCPPLTSCYSHLTLKRRITDQVIDCRHVLLHITCILRRVLVEKRYLNLILAQIERTEACRYWSTLTKRLAACVTYRRRWQISLEDLILQLNPAIHRVSPAVHKSSQVPR